MSRGSGLAPRRPLHPQGRSSGGAGQVEGTAPADGGVGSAPITIRFTYDPAEPYGVELLFTAAGIRPPGVSWLVGRDLLITGAERACGEGDVRVTTYSLTDATSRS
jgi:hypothetical protein